MVDGEGGIGRVNHVIKPTEVVKHLVLWSLTSEVSVNLAHAVVQMGSRAGREIWGSAGIELNRKKGLKS